MRSLLRGGGLRNGAPRIILDRRFAVRQWLAAAVGWRYRGSLLDSASGDYADFLRVRIDPPSLAKAMTAATLPKKD
jgi:hypothetical protein